jgi:Lrp/AsnC family leucine-responsive transcriptional regulator
MTMFDLDEKDWKILLKLRDNSRVNVSDLASELQIPRTTVQERINRLVRNGIIKKFTIQQDHSKLGKPVTAFIMVSFSPGTGLSQREAAESIAAMEDVHEVHLISGEWDIIAKARGDSLESIGKLVIDRIRNVRGVGKTLTCASFLCVKENI